METAYEQIREPLARCQSWEPAIADVVELSRHGRTIRIGVVESVLPDGKGFWLAAHGLDTRVYVPNDEAGLEIRIRPTPRSGVEAQSVVLVPITVQP
ncbi:MAG: hypothetical protein ACXVA6_18445 [Isosphaeraceae bacterium]